MPARLDTTGVHEARAAVAEPGAELVDGVAVRLTVVATCVVVVEGGGTNGGITKVDEWPHAARTATAVKPQIIPRITRPPRSAYSL
jgi:hypothetical protein